MKQTALITGASSGIGRDLAPLFARDGYDLVLVARSEGKLRELAGEMESKYGVKATVITSDLAKPDAVRELVDALAARNIDVDILVNNAGLGLSGAFVETDWTQEAQELQVNVVALTQLTKLLMPPMVARGRGRILNLASTASFQPGPLMAVYYATKAYVLSFSEALAEELRNSGVTVTALCPGPTETQFAETAKATSTRLFSLRKAMSSEKVARIGYRAMQRGRRVVITGFMNRVMAESVRISPRSVVTKVVRRIQERA